MASSNPYIYVNLENLYILMDVVLEGITPPPGPSGDGRSGGVNDDIVDDFSWMTFWILFMKILLVLVVYHREEGGRPV